MAQRTTISAVTAVLRPASQNGDYDDVNNPSLQPFIDAASAMVDDASDLATGVGQSLSAAKLELIERWLAAHFYVMSDKTFTSKSTSGASGSFNGQTTQGLDASLYGQMAQRLDTSGSLRQLDKRLFPKVMWLGKNPSDQIDYEDRR